MVLAAVVGAWGDGTAVGDSVVLTPGPLGLGVVASGPTALLSAYARDERGIGPLSLAPGNGLIAAVQLGHRYVVHRTKHPDPGQNQAGAREEDLGFASLWRLDLADRELYGSPDRGQGVPLVTSDTAFTEVTGAAASADATWVATDAGLLRVTGVQAHAFRPEWSALFGSMQHRARGWRRLRAVGVDATGRVWVAGRQALPPRGLFVFEAGKSEEETRVATSWLNPVEMAVSPRAAGAWVLARDTSGRTAVVHVTAAMVAAPARAESIVPATAPRFALSRMRLAADGEGALWVAGQDRRGVHVYRCLGETATEQHGFEGLLFGGRITDIAAGEGGRVYFATDSVGVIAYDGGEWRAHPINGRLPRLFEGDLQPVYQVLPLPDGGLCASVDTYLVIWRPQ